MTNAIGADDLVELVAVVKESDTVELKLTVPDDALRSTLESLGFDVLEAEIRQVVFFETPDLDLDRSGVVVRARRRQGGGGDTVVKLRPVVPAHLPSKLRRSKRLGVEVDAMPGGFVCSASMKGSACADSIRQVSFGHGPIKGLFSKKQRAFFKEYAPKGLKLNDLAIFGPMLILKLKSVPEGFDRKMVAEVWVYPDGSRVFELSTKCLPGETFQVAAEWRADLIRHGVDLSGVQQTKTKRALTYFSSQLRTS